MRHSGMSSLVVVAALAVLGVMTTACEEEAKPGITRNINPEITPTMLTRNVETLISDSGITRFRIVSPIWLVYDEAKVPRWRFPKGLKLEKFDDALKVAATVECDSAIYFKNKQLWQLDGIVKITNAGGVKFLTRQLLWDQKLHKVYSDSFMRIEKPDRTLEGYGFTANERLTSYQIHRVSGIFPAKAVAPTAGASGAYPPAPKAASLVDSTKSSH